MKKVDFVYLVAQMRDAQKEYFRYRLRRDLDKCKDFEKRVVLLIIGSMGN